MTEKEPERMPYRVKALVVIAFVDLQANERGLRMERRTILGGVPTCDVDQVRALIQQLIDIEWPVRYSSQIKHIDITPMPLEIVAIPKRV
jgi:hypothetical protein